MYTRILLRTRKIGNLGFKVLLIIEDVVTTTKRFANVSLAPVTTFPRCY